MTLTKVKYHSLNYVLNCYYLQGLFLCCARRWLSCRQPVCLQPRQLCHGTDRQTDGSRYSKTPPRGRGIITKRTRTGHNGAVVAGCKRCSEAKICVEDDVDDIAAAFELVQQPVTYARIHASVVPTHASDSSVTDVQYKV